MMRDRLGSLPTGRRGGLPILLMVVALLSGLNATGWAQVETLPFYESFAYPTGDLNRAPGFESIDPESFSGGAISAEAILDPIQVVAGSLAYPGTPLSEGHRVVYRGVYDETILRRFGPPVDQGDLFVSMLLRVPVAPSWPDSPAVFFTLNETALDGDYEYGLLIIHQGSQTGTYRLGITLDFLGTPVYTPDLNPGETYYLIFHLALLPGVDNNVVDLWVNPRPGSNVMGEGALHSLHHAHEEFEYDTGFEFVDGYRLIQDDSAGEWVVAIDEIRMARTYGAANLGGPILTPLPTPVEPSPTPTEPTPTPTVIEPTLPPPSPAIIIMDNLQGDPFAPGGTITVDVVLDNQTRRLPIAFTVAARYPTDSVTLTGALTADLNAQIILGAATHDAEWTVQSVGTIGDFNNTLMSLRLTTLQFTVSSSPAAAYSILLEPAVGQSTLTDNSFVPIEPVWFDNSLTDPIGEPIPEPTPTLSPTETPNVSPTPLPTPPNNVIYVSADASASGDGTSWARAFPSVNHALNSALPGQQIWVARGVYAEAIRMRSGVNLFGGFAGFETRVEQRDLEAGYSVLDGRLAADGSPARVVVLAEAIENAEINGFQIEGGVGGEFAGGGIVAFNVPETVRFVACDIVHNSSEDGGGGVAVFANAAPVFMNCFIAFNEAKFGGGVYVQQSTPRFVDCAIVENVALEDGGALMAFDQCDVGLVNSLVARNHSQNFVGGLSIQNKSVVQIEVCDITSNTCLAGGGAGVDIYDDSVANIKDSLIAENRNDGDYGAGGLFAFNRSILNIQTTRIADNFSSGGAAGVMIEFAGLVMNQCDIVGNNGATNGVGGIGITTGRSIEINDCWIADNRGRYAGAILSENQSALLNVTHCDIVGNVSESGGGGIVLIESPGRVATSLIAGNSAGEGNGGGMECYRGALELIETDLIGNEAPINGGGGVWIETDQPVYIVRSLVEGNSAAYGGGLGGYDVLNLLIEDAWIGDNAAQYGGGLLFSHSSPRLVGCSIIGNMADEYAGGAEFSEGSTPQIEDCVIADNWAAFGGGGIKFVGKTNGLIADSILAHNATDEMGGGLFIDESAGNIVNTTIIGNTAGSDGGGVAVSWLSSPTLTGCSIIQNEAVWGAGLYVDESVPTIIQCNISGNVSSNAGGGLLFTGGSQGRVARSVVNANTAMSQGAGIACYDQSNPTIENGLIAHNTVESESEGMGGALFCYEAAPSLVNCTVQSNTAEQGGGVYLEYLSSPTLRNNIFSANAAFAIYESWADCEPNVLYNLFDGGAGFAGDYFDDGENELTGADAINALARAQGNIEGDPLYRPGLIGAWTEGPVYDEGRDQTILIDTEQQIPLLITGVWVEDAMSVGEPVLLPVIAATSQTLRIPGHWSEYGLTTDSILVAGSYELVDLRLSAESPAIDTGSAIAPQRDILDQRRPVDIFQVGVDGSGFENDMGAFEYRSESALIVLRPGEPGEPIAFGRQLVAAGPSQPLVVSIRNTGLRPLNFPEPFTIIGLNASEFIFSPAPDVSPLQVDDSRNIRIVFDPDSAGAKSATLVITTDAEDPDLKVIEIELVGTGLTAIPSPTPVPTPSPTPTPIPTPTPLTPTPTIPTATPTGPAPPSPTPVSTPTATPTATPTTRVWIQAETLTRGQTGSFTVMVDAKGAENGIAFQLEWDSTLLEYQSYSKAANSPIEVLVPNDSKGAQGELTFITGMNPGSAFSAGDGVELVTVTVKAVAGSESVSASVRFATDYANEVSSVEGPPLPSVFENYAIELMGALAPTPTPGETPATPATPTPTPPIDRVVRVVDTAIDRGQSGEVTLQFLTKGDENAVAFSLTFNPDELTYVSHAMGADVSGSIGFVNTNNAASGVLTALIGKSPGETMAAGTLELLKITFQAVEGDATIQSAITFSDTPTKRSVSDAEANNLNATFLNGTVTIQGAVPPTPTPPDAPVNQAPLDGATSESLTPTLMASAFASSVTGATHSASQWRIRAASSGADYADSVWDSGTVTDALMAATVPTGRLNYSTTYAWSVRYQGSNGGWSEWSAETTFATLADGDVNTPPEKPVNESPKNGQAGVSVTPRLEASIFVDANTGDFLTATRWRIRSATGAYDNPVYDSGEQISSARTHDVASSFLDGQTVYFWQVSYRDSRGVWSEWSNETNFQTVASGSLSAPGGLRAAAGAQSVWLTWLLHKDSSVVGYNLYRSTDANADGELVTTESVRGSEYLDKDLTPGAAYYYRLTAVSSNGTESIRTQGVPATVGATRLFMTDTRGEPGQTISQMITIDNPNQIANEGLQIEVNYDTTLLKPVSVKKTNLTQHFDFFDNHETADGRLVIAAIGSNLVITGEGHVLEVQYQVVDSAELWTESSHSFHFAELVDESANTVLLDFTSTASMTVASKIELGDVSKDDRVSVLDAVQLQKIITGEMVQTDYHLTAGDINGDNLLDSADLVLLMRMIVGGSTPDRSIRIQKIRMADTQVSHHLRFGAQTVVEDQIRIPMLVDNLQDVAGLDLVINYNAQHLTLEGVEQGPAIPFSTWRVFDENGQLRISTAGSDGLSAGGGEVATLVFTPAKGWQTTNLVVAKFKVSDETSLNLSRTRTVDSDDGTLIQILSAERTYSGIVSDALSGDPIAGAVVTIQGLDAQTMVTDASGLFSLTVPVDLAGQIHLSVRRLGYQPFNASQGTEDGLVINAPLTPIEDWTALYDFIYKGDGVWTFDTLSKTITIEGGGPKDKIKIKRRKGVTGEAIAPLIQTDGSIKKFYTDVPVARLVVADQLAALTAKNSHVESTEAGEIGKVKMTAVPVGDDGFGTSGTVAYANILTTSDRPFKSNGKFLNPVVKLSGVILDGFDASLQKGAATIQSASKVNKAPDKSKYVSLGAIEQLDTTAPHLWAQVGGDPMIQDRWPDRLSAHEFKKIVTKGGSISPESIEADSIKTVAATGLNLKVKSAVGVKDYLALRGDVAPVRIVSKQLGTKLQVIAKGGDVRVGNISVSDETQATGGIFAGGDIQKIQAAWSKFRTPTAKVAMGGVVGFAPNDYPNMPPFMLVESGVQDIKALSAKNYNIKLIKGDVAIFGVFIAADNRSAPETVTPTAAIQKIVTQTAPTAWAQPSQEIWWFTVSGQGYSVAEPKIKTKNLVFEVRN